MIVILFLLSLDFFRLFLRVYMYTEESINFFMLLEICKSQLNMCVLRHNLYEYMYVPYFRLLQFAPGNSKGEPTYVDENGLRHFEIPVMRSLTVQEYLDYGDYPITVNISNLVR